MNASNRRGREDNRLWTMARPSTPQPHFAGANRQPPGPHLAILWGKAAINGRTDHPTVSRDENAFAGEFVTASHLQSSK